MPYGVNQGDVQTVAALQAPAAITADGVTTGIDITAYDGEIAIIVSNSAGTQTGGSTDRSLAMKIQECDTLGGSYTDVAGGGLTTLLVTAGVQKLSLNSDELKKFILLSYDISGANTPTYLISANVVGTLKNPA